MRTVTVYECMFMNLELVLEWNDDDDGDEIDLLQKEPNNLYDYSMLS